jgi:PAS domain S-box-containing protein/putative nucleotidyltransferase with HDIG domain
MLDNVASYFDAAGFMPHGHCFLWTPALLWTYVVSDLAIAASYFSIPAALWYLFKKRPDLPFGWIFSMAALFVMACGTTHLFAVWNIWNVDYWSDAALKALTATISAATAILLWPLIPKVLSIPSHEQLKTANRDLQEQIARRVRAEDELRLANERLERRVAERTAKIAESEEKYRSLIHASGDAVLLTSADGGILAANPEACRMFDMTEAEFIGGGRGAVVDSTDPRLKPLLEERRRIGKVRGELNCIRKGGSRFPVEISSVAFKDRAGNARNSTVIRDVSERKRAEESIRESEARFRAIIEQSITGICIIDARGRFIYLNPRLAQILGYDDESALVGKPIVDTVAQESRESVMSIFQRGLAGAPHGGRHNFTALRSDGTRITLGTHGTAGSYRGEPVVISTVQDVTEVVRAEEEIARHVVRLERAIQSTIEVVSTIGEMRDPYTHGHERRVGEIGAAIAKDMGLSEDRVEGIRVAGYLHDVGKIAIPAEILAKPARLSSAEFSLVKQHAEQGYEILKGVEFPWPVAEAAWQHHERLDGSGYPRGLKGDEIVVEARILAVADVIEAMSSHRPYRASLGIEPALKEIELGAGKTYDGDVAAAALRLFREKGYTVPA